MKRFKTRRRGYIKVLGYGRQGRPIYDELQDTLTLPTMFEQAYPFEWPAAEQLVLEAAPVMLALEAAPAPVVEEDVRPPTDDELVSFWTKLAADPDHKKPMRRARD